MNSCPHCNAKLSHAVDWRAHAAVCRRSVTVIYNGQASVLDPLSSDNDWREMRRRIDMIIWEVGRERLLATTPPLAKHGAPPHGE